MHLAIIQHRADLRPDGVPEPLRATSVRFRAALANELETLASTPGESGRPRQDLQGALAEVEQAASQLAVTTTADVVAQVRARLALYRKTVPIVVQIARLTAQK